MQYLLDHFPESTFFKKNVSIRGMSAPGQNVSGYGNKISTDYMVKLNNRNYRVYCIIWSNNGSLYVIVNKKRYYIRNFDIPEDVKNEV